MNQRLALTLVSSSYSSACSGFRTEDGWGGYVHERVAKPLCLWRWMSSISEVEQRRSRGGFLWVKAAVSFQSTSLPLLWTLYFCGQQKGELCASQLFAFICRNISADSFIRKILYNLQDILCRSLAYLKRLLFFNMLSIWPKSKGEEERVNNYIEKGISLEQKPSLQIPKQWGKKFFNKILVRFNRSKNNVFSSKKMASLPWQKFPIYILPEATIPHGKKISPNC